MHYLHIDNPESRARFEPELTPDELEAASKAQYTIRAIGSPAILGFTDDLERAYGRALWFADRTMQAEGTQIDVRDIPDKHIELRISDDRLVTTVQWVHVEATEDSTVQP